MKTALVVVSIFCSSFFNNSLAVGTVNMSEKLDEVVKFENNSLPIEKNKTEFVKVSFKINEEGKLQVLDANYSDEEVKQQLMDKLNEVTIDVAHDPEKVYYYNFTFKKM